MGMRMERLGMGVVDADVVRYDVGELSAEGGGMRMDAFGPRGERGLVYCVVL